MSHHVPLYGRGKGHFLTAHDLELVDDTLEHVEDTADPDLDGEDDSDEAPMFDDEGWTHLTDEFDDEDAYEALEEAWPGDEYSELPVKETMDAVDYMRPLSKTEEGILEETPFLQTDKEGRYLDFVDDRDHEEWLLNRALEGHKGMDVALMDTTYGEPMDYDVARMTDEELALATGTDDVGQLRRKLKRGLKRTTGGLKRVARVTKRAALAPAKKAAKLVRKFVPKRDAGKAKMVKALHLKLVREHANFLQAKDLRRRVRRPRALYERRAKAWSSLQIKKAGLPTSYSSGENDLAHDILGGDVLGQWWNPRSWFRKRVKYVLVDTEGQRLREMSEEEYAAYRGTKEAIAERPGEPGEPPEHEASPEEEEAAEEEEGPSDEEITEEVVEGWR